MLSEFISSKEWRDMKLHLSRQILELSESLSAIANNMVDITKTNIELIKIAERVRCYKEIIDLPYTLFETEEKEKVKSHLNKV